MENFDKIFTLVAEVKGIGLNLDILETGVINIIALIIILIFVSKDAVSNTLNERKESIKESVENAENRIKEAELRLTEARKQLAQATLLISRIKKDSVQTRKTLLCV